ncbi:MAG: 16S rRNA (cytidine(1402)-2'-O)-methyltransferase [Acidobacteriota bacterium]
MHHDSSPAAGTLLLIASPIGNLDDISPRARQALAAADLVACEDTRVTGRLLHHLGLDKRMLSMHDHNERARLPRLLDTLAQGLTIALVSDAGTPLVSDPGFPLVREAAARGVRIEAIPGPSAFLLALIVSGLPPYPFTFAGFPPAKSGKRRRFYKNLRALDHTLIVYESPHRIVASLDDAATALDNRPAVIARELTKLHEEVLRGTLKTLRLELGARPSIKGELVLVIGGAQLPLDQAG